MKMKVIDINNMSFYELAGLPWVSSELAKEIYDYKQEHGDFKNWEELGHVPGMTNEAVEEFKRSGAVLVSKPREAITGAEPESGRCRYSGGADGGMGSDDVEDIWDAEFIRR